MLLQVLVRFADLPLQVFQGNVQIGQASACSEDFVLKVASTQSKSSLAE
jgi:hypothetical protein